MSNVQLPLQPSTPILSIEGAVATLCLNRPDQANRIEAADIPVILEYCALLSKKAGQVRALILTAKGKHFSAGYNIGSVMETLQTNATEDKVNNVFGGMVDAVEALPQISICALNGGVFGGSTDLALACDFRIGVPTTRLFMPAVKLGLHYYPSGIRRYMSRLGLNAAKRLFLLADELNATELLSLGYLDRIVEPSDLISAALEVCAKVVATAPLASAGMKAAINTLAAGTYESELVAMAEVACLQSADLVEGALAWRERRPARFIGE